jgi:hypothetical protein
VKHRYRFCQNCQRRCRFTKESDEGGAGWAILWIFISMGTHLVIMACHWAWDAIVNPWYCESCGGADR